MGLPTVDEQRSDTVEGKAHGRKKYSNTEGDVEHTSLFPSSPPTFPRKPGIWQRNKSSEGFA